ncbi:hypothetical protein GCM10027265_03140 [Jatrophihabitans fulvus]
MAAGVSAKVGVTGRGAGRAPPRGRGERCWVWVGRPEAPRRRAAEPREVELVKVFLRKRVARPKAAHAVRRSGTSPTPLIEQGVDEAALRTTVRTRSARQLVPV